MFQLRGKEAAPLVGGAVRLIAKAVKLEQERL
jgi:hypothetical protein